MASNVQAEYKYTYSVHRTLGVCELTTVTVHGREILERFIVSLDIVHRYSHSECNTQ